MAADKNPEGSESTAESNVASELQSGSAAAEPLGAAGSGAGPGSPTGGVEAPVGSQVKGHEVEQMPVAPVTEGDSSTGKGGADNDQKVVDDEEDENAEAESGEGNTSLNLAHCSGGIFMVFFSSQ